MTARILIVDDTPLNLKLLAARLTHEYYMVTSATNGAEALEKIAAEKPDIVLLDVMMPEMDGFETCRRIKADPESAHIPVVMVTALTDATDRVRGLEAGADDFLSKPINDTALLARVRSLLRLKTIMDEWRLRETTSSQLMSRAPADEAALGELANSRALLLEDSVPDQEMISATLSAHGCTVDTVDKIGDAASMVRTGFYDVVFASLDLRNEDGLQICPHLRTHEASRQTPILLLANDSEMERVAKGLDLGANDYLLRPLDANELVARTRTQVKHKRHYDRLRKNYEDSLALALVDPLTGAFNRRYLEAHFPRMLARSRAVAKPLSLLMIDVDHFKAINDTHGHGAGDAALRGLVDRVMNGVRPSDLVARLGGEEFVVVMPETSLQVAHGIAERLREYVAATPIALSDKGLETTITISVGCACLSEGKTETMESVLRRADAALYKAKENGRNRVVDQDTAAAAG